MQLLAEEELNEIAARSPEDCEEPGLNGWSRFHASSLPDNTSTPRDTRNDMPSDMLANELAEDVATGRLRGLTIQAEDQLMNQVRPSILFQT